MPFWILVLVIGLAAMTVIVFAIREHSREMTFGAMAMVIAGAAMVIVALVFLR